MITHQSRFPILVRLLHWLWPRWWSQCSSSVGMVASVSERYGLLVSIHRPLGDRHPRAGRDPLGSTG